MRIAIMADIHGNLPAFEAVLGHVRQQRPDMVVLAGDIVNGLPDSAACWHLAQECGGIILRGNHERYVYNHHAPDAPAVWQTPQFAPVKYTVTQFDAATRASMAALPMTIRLPDLPDLLITHATPRSDSETVLATTSEADLAATFAEQSAPLVVRAHNHVCMIRLWSGGIIANAGSVGLPLTGRPDANYLLLERRNAQWQIEHQAVPYDLAALMQRVRETSYIERSGPIGQLIVREAITGSHQVMPFFRYRDSLPADTPLDVAVRQFLTHI